MRFENIIKDQITNIQLQLLEEHRLHFRETSQNVCQNSENVPYKLGLCAYVFFNGRVQLKSMVGYHVNLCKLLNDKHILKIKLNKKICMCLPVLCWVSSTKRKTIHFQMVPNIVVIPNQIRENVSRDDYEKSLHFLPVHIHVSQIMITSNTKEFRSLFIKVFLSDFT